MSATTLSCPECSATLKSGTPIPAGRKIQCPKCGTVFAAPAPDEDAPFVREKAPTTEPANEAPGDDGEDVPIVRKKARPSMPAEQFNDEESPDDQGEEDFDEEPIRRPLRRRKKRRSNTTKILAVSIGSALIVLIFVGGTFFAIKNYVIDKGRNKGTGKENPLAFVPADSTVVFGVDLGPLWEQPAVAAQIEKAFGQNPQDFFADLKKNTGIEKHELLDRVIFASKINLANPMQPPLMTLIFQSKVPFNQNKVRDSEKELVAQTAGGKTYYKRSGAASAQVGWVYMPSDRIMIFSNLPENQMKELVESDGVSPKLPAPVTSMAEDLEKSLFWMVLPFTSALKEQMQKGLAMGDNNPPELAPVNQALLQAKMLALSSTLANDKISLQVSLVCADEGSAKQVATSLQGYWDKNSKGLAGLQMKLGLAFLPKEFQAMVKEMLENLQFSSQGATAQASTQFTAPSAEILARLVANQGVFAPRGGPGGQVPGGPPPGFRFQGPPGGFKKPGA
jgi:hypothetical protein